MGNWKKVKKGTKEVAETIINDVLDPNYAAQAGKKVSGTSTMYKSRKLKDFLDKKKQQSLSKNEDKEMKEYTPREVAIAVLDACKDMIKKSDLFAKKENCEKCDCSKADCKCEKDCEDEADLKKESLKKEEMEKAQIHDIKTKKMIHDTKDYDPKLRSEKRGDLRIASEKQGKRFVARKKVSGEDK